jgi:hypothetical protein
MDRLLFREMREHLYPKTTVQIVRDPFLPRTADDLRRSAFLASMAWPVSSAYAARFTPSNS